MVICLEQGADELHMVQLMPLQPHHLCFRKIQNGSSYQPTRVVLEKRLFSGFCVENTQYGLALNPLNQPTTATPFCVAHLT